MQTSNPMLCDKLEGAGWEVGDRFKREGHDECFSGKLL